MSVFDDLVKILEKGGPHRASTCGEIARMILNDHADELAHRIKDLIPSADHRQGSQAAKDAFQAGLLVAAMEIAPEDSDPPKGVDLRPTREELRDAEYVLGQNVPGDVLSAAEGILGRARWFGVRE